MSDNESAPGRAAADAEFAALIHRAEQGRLGPADFQRCDELRPYVSPELTNPRGSSR